MHKVQNFQDGVKKKKQGSNTSIAGTGATGPQGPQGLPGQTVLMVMMEQ